MYCTVGRRPELEKGMAGKDPLLYRRMLDEIAEYVQFADENGYAGWGHPEHHLQIEGFEASNDPTLMGMYIGQHSKRLKVITCGFVSSAHNPVRTAEAISTMDNMLRGRFAVGLVRGYQSRWVETLKVKEDIYSVGPWNKNTEEDATNRRYFAEYVDLVVHALTQDTFNYRGEFWHVPSPGLTNPHPHPVYTEYGEGVAPDMSINKIGIAPRPYQTPHPKLYGGFSASLRTAKFWAKYRGKPIVMSSDIDFLKLLWEAYREEAESRYDYTPESGEMAAWGGLMICAKSDNEAKALAEDMKWMWKSWAVPFGQPFPELLFGSPDTLCRRIEEVSAAVPLNEIFLIIPQGIHGRDHILSSLELFAEKVITKFN